MHAAWYRARAELRERWRSAAVLVLVVGIAGGALLTTIAGARRSDTAYQRFREETRAGDLDISFDGPPTEDMDAAGEAIAALPQVEAVGRVAYPFVVPKGRGMYPYLEFLAASPLDGSFGVDVEVPRVVDGRAPDPSAPLEVGLIEGFARQAGLGVGDRFDVESYAPHQMEALFGTGDAGPPGRTRALDAGGRGAVRRDLRDR